MKKLFIAILGVAAFAACSQEMTLETPKGAAIAFDNAFVENATRAADYTADNITDFSVYGFITKDTEGAIFTDQKVAGSNAAGFTYSPAQYWVGGATYSFSALVPYEGRHWEYAATNSGNGVISFNNQTAVANQDLLFAYATRTTPASITAAPEAVAFTFDHVLSRVKFSFVNGFGDGQNITLKVTNVNITNAYANGTLALENGVLAEAWTPADKNLNVAFGDAGQELAVNKEGETTHYYLIPAEDTYEVTFTVAIYQSGVLVDTYDRTATVTVALERGKSYDLQATLTANNTSDDGALYPIEFTVGTVNGWENYTGADVTVPEHVVATAAELSAAVAEGGNIVLTQDINLDEVSSRANAYAGLTIDNDVVIDGAGHKLTSSATRAINIVGGHTVTIKNAEVVAGNTSADYYRAINVEGANNNVTLENVTAYAYYYTVNLVSSVDNCVLNINNCNITGITAINVWGTNSVVTVNNSVLTCDQAPVSNVENYAVIMVNSDNSTVTVNGGEIVADAGNLGGAVDADGSAIVFNGTNGNCTIENHPYVISYGDNKYSMATWEEAYETAKDGETIMLTQDATLDTTCSIEKDITLDLNGKTLTIAAKDATVVDLKNYGKMNLINGKIAAGNAEASRRCVYNYGEMTINNVEFVQTYGAKGAAINNEAKMTIENATVNSVYYAIWNSGANAELVVNGGTFNCVGNNDTWKPSNDSVAWCYAVTNRNGAKMTVNGGYFSGNHGVIAAYEGSEVTLNAGTYECFATMSGVSDWVLYAYGDGTAVKYSADCDLKHATKAADACCTTEANGVVAQF